MNKKIDLSKIDLEKEKEKITDYPGLIEYAHTIGSALIRPEDKGRIKGNAIAAMHEQTDRQFRQLAEQMKLLVSQAEYLKKRIEISERIYLASMGFQPVINKVYFLYKRKNGEDVLSMVSPEEWGRKIPFESFEAEVRLMADHTWEIVRTSNESFYS
ncbi:MAG: DUF2452 domain-containing protein [Cyclobacteriaceae bacterium]|nr:DUF2452 domain-containing protein [Cyclobacteriaceae bacterium]